MKKILFFVLAALTFAACEQALVEEQSAICPDVPETITVGFEGDDTRIQLNDAQKTVWTKGDLVSVFYRSNANQKWQYQGETGERIGTIKRIANAEATQELSDIVVVYPYNKNYYINLRTNNVQASLPAVHNYLANSYGLDGNIMISSSEYNQFSLKNVCGWLKIKLIGEGQVVKKITLKGNNGEQVAGEIYINSADATSILASEMSTADDGENSVGGNLVFDDTILSEVTLNCGDGVTLGSEATAFYIALPPQTFEKGLTITCYYGDNTTMTKSTSDSIEIARNTIVPMSTLYYDGNKPPVFELNYTTNDGQPLDPYTTDGFGANFIENIYDVATGQGALKFDARITTIPDKAFIGCNNLTSITLSQDIKSIGAEAFSGCSKLAIMNIPNNVTLIGNMAFYNCSGIQEITIPSSVTSIGSSSFKGCSGKANINCYIKEVSTRDGGENGAFYRAKFTEAIIGEGVTSIGSYAFWYCTSLSSITIPNSVTWIGNSAFNKCESLTSVTIPDSVTSIAKFAFSSCSGMKVLTLGSKVSSIQERAFSGCSSLESVIITNNKGINMYNGAFEDCDNMESVYYNDDLINWFNMNFEYGSSNPLDNGARLYINGTELTEIDVPNDISAIKDYTFNGCTSITKVTMHNRVTSVGHSTFCECFNLKEVYCMTTIPPTCGTTTFSYYKNGEFYPLGCKIYVPIGSVEAYKVADGWNSYVSHIEGYEF